jgi:ATP-dependent protease ClpP protease subunit
MYMLNNKRRRLNNGSYTNGPMNFLEPEPEMNIETIDNHIYYYAEVNTKSAFTLVKELHELDSKIQGNINKKNKRKRKRNNDNIIHLHIHSEGGCVFSCFTIVDKIRSLRTPVYSYINGMAASSATMISVVCSKRFIYRNAYMLIHQLSSGFEGKYNEIVDDMENNESLMVNIKRIYREHTHIHGNALDKILSRDIWWNATKCIENGLADEII